MVLDYQDGPMSSQGSSKWKEDVRVREMGGCHAAGFGGRKGQKPRNVGASRSWKSLRTVLPWSFQREHIDLSPGDPLWPPDLQHCEMIVSLVPKLLQ